MSTIAHKLDARGMNCPLPVLRTRKAINQINSGECVEVIATDPGSVKDMESFCTQTGNRLVSSNETDNNYIFIIEKS
jgi:tRNA 2-thiouridine synthesizing protein A